ncbi:MAG: DNA repair protein RecN [Alphaproteobacteria bacterium GM202ARS2]|nr:DNA repair protein RecN [Alphaproteobacteria bacterium GM202ARS2]
MLCHLSIRNILSLTSIDVDLSKGLSVLTGETGAGKSILLDALGLALGFRAESGLLDKKQKQGSVVATFRVDTSLQKDLQALLAEHGIDVTSGEILLRRVLTEDGRSRAFINDVMVGVALMRACGCMLVEIEGQFADQGLLRVAHHRTIVDSVLALDEHVATVARLHDVYRTADEACQSAQTSLQKQKEQEAYDRACLEELDRINPLEGEATQLTEKRRLLASHEQIHQHVNDAQSAIEGGDVDSGSGNRQAGDGLSGRMQNLRRSIHFLAEKAPERFGDMAKSIDSACLELAEVGTALTNYHASLAEGNDSLESVEERLFTLRDVARKHNVDPDALPAVHTALAERISTLEQGAHAIEARQKAKDDAWRAYRQAVLQLREKRQKGVKDLDRQIMAELAPLKLDKAQFETRVEPLDENNWGATGGDRVVFMVALNPGSEKGPLHKVASGGERSRLMLALRVVTSQASCPPTLIFDEIDRGIGGAVADAVGKRMARLAQKTQVILVTHSPQVTSVASHHYRIDKTMGDTQAITNVFPLQESDRVEEVARMLSGEQITQEARAAAARLLASHPIS